MAAKRTEKKKPVVVQTLVNPGLKKRWDAASKIVNEATREEAEDFDRKWEAVGEIINSDPPLYLAGGFSTDKDFFVKFLGVDPVTAVRRARVARFASPKELERYGDTKIDAVLDYLEAKAGGPIKDKLPVALGAVRVAVVAEGKTTRLGLAETTREQLRAATRALKQKTKGDAKASPRGAVVLEALTRAGLKIDLSVHRATVDLRAIAFDDLVALGKALSALELPQPS